MTDTHLLDVNVLVALVWPSHVHHPDARRWFGGRGDRGWATTPVTESGFVRVSSNPRVTRDALRPPEALEVLRAMRAEPGHAFLVDDLELVLHHSFDPSRVVSHAQVTDAHLVAVARRHGARLATFDRGIEALADPGEIVLIPVAG